MPIYEYACRDCGEVLEVILRQGERQPRKCRKCSGRLDKLISRTSFQLKGGGWFDHGYSKGGSSSSSDSSSTKNESKDESKKEPKKEKKKEKKGSTDGGSSS